MTTFIIVRKLADDCDDIFVTVQPNENFAWLHYQRKSSTTLSVQQLKKVCRIHKLQKHGDFEYFEL